MVLHFILFIVLLFTSANAFRLPSSALKIRQSNTIKCIPNNIQYPSLSFISVSQWNLLHEYAALLSNWNTKVNLVSRKDINQLFNRHIIPCISISMATKFVDGSEVADVGTGGGKDRYYMHHILYLLICMSYSSL